MSAVGTELACPAVVRGRLVWDDPVRFGGRGGTASFTSPDPQRLLSSLALRDPRALQDVQELAFEEIVAFLAEVGRRLRLEDNAHLQEALRESEGWSDMTAPLVRSSFEQLPTLFAPDAVRELADATVGLPYLEGWVTRTMRDGRHASIRAFGARAVHIVAGNSPLIAALSIVRNAVTRSDAIVKTPSNDPLTSLAIARTMAEVDADHPLTRHLSVAYWKGGDTELESRLLHPSLVEKVVAWGGLASVTHVLRYVQPGLELVSLDPKRSATIIGPEAFASDAALEEAAQRTAADVGALNQLGCVNARVVYVASGTDDAGLDAAWRFGTAVHRHLLALPEAVSTPAKWFDPELGGRLDALRTSPDFYRVVGGEHGEGAVVVSLVDEPVDFAGLLSGRVANVVPVDDVADALPAIDASTQTVGVYPDELQGELRDRLALRGTQRIVSLGYAAHANLALPQDGMEPVRRMVRWIVDERCDPDVVAPLWV